MCKELLFNFLNLLEFNVNVLALHFPASRRKNIGLSKIFPGHWNPRRCQGLLQSSWIISLSREQQACAFQRTFYYFKLQPYGDISFFSCADIFISSWCSTTIYNLDFLLWCRISIPLILSLPETVYSLTKKGQLKVCN